MTVVGPLSGFLRTNVRNQTDSMYAFVEMRHLQMRTEAAPPPIPVAHLWRRTRIVCPFNKRSVSRPIAEVLDLSASA